MSNFTQMLQSWQIFYATVATASATLTGLLFVSLSLDRNRLDNEAFTIARRAFGNLLNILILSLLLLIPQDTPLGLSIGLFIFGFAQCIGYFRDAITIIKGKRHRSAIQLLFREIGLPLLSSLGIVGVAIAIYYGLTSAMYWPVGVIVMLLITASWNAWVLLVKNRAA